MSLGQMRRIVLCNKNSYYIVCYGLLFDNLFIPFTKEKKIGSVWHRHKYDKILVMFTSYTRFAKLSKLINCIYILFYLTHCILHLCTGKSKQLLRVSYHILYTFNEKYLLGVYFEFIYINAV